MKMQAEIVIKDLSFDDYDVIHYIKNLQQPNCIHQKLENCFDNKLL